MNCPGLLCYISCSAKVGSLTEPHAAHRHAQPGGARRSPQTSEQALAALRAAARRRPAGPSQGVGGRKAEPNGVEEL